MCSRRFLLVELKHRWFWWKSLHSLPERRASRLFWKKSFSWRQEGQVEGTSNDTPTFLHMIQDPRESVLQGRHSHSKSILVFASCGCLPNHECVTIPLFAEFLQLKYLFCCNKHFKRKVGTRHAEIMYSNSLLCHGFGGSFGTSV